MTVDGTEYPKRVVQACPCGSGLIGSAIEKNAQGTKPKQEYFMRGSWSFSVRYGGAGFTLLWGEFRTYFSPAEDLLGDPPFRCNFLAEPVLHCKESL